MGKQLDKIRAQEMLTPSEILAGLIWDRAINTKERIFKVQYYRFPCYIEYSHESQYDSFSLDCLYLGQEHSFMLIQPKYKEVLEIAPQILEWLDATYALCCPPEPPKPKRQKAPRRPPRPLMKGPLGGNALNQNNQTTQNNNKRGPRNSAQ